MVDGGGRTLLLLGRSASNQPALQRWGTAVVPAAGSVLIDGTVTGGVDFEEAADVRALGLTPIVVKPS